MAKKTRSMYQQEQIDRARDMQIYKHNDMIQRSRYTLTVQEQRIVLYAISKIRADDTYLNEYEFDIKDFYDLCGIDNRSYTRLKQMLLSLKQKVWWLLMEDGVTESAVSWFDVIRLNKNSSTVTVAFHRDMMPYLLRLAQNNQFYTKYNLRNVLPMRGQYSPRLYEIIKSYQINNLEWYFEIDKLKQLLDCTNYDNFAAFRRRVLDPAVKEINEFTDISVAYDTDNKGRKTVGVIFYMTQKKAEAAWRAKENAARALDGQISLDEVYEQLQSDTPEGLRFLEENF